MKKKQREYRLREALFDRQDFLISKLKEEWDAAEKAVRREALVRQTKESALMVGKGILALMAVAGMITVAAVAPNVFAAFGKFGKRRFYDRKQFQRAASYLKGKEFAKIEKNNGGEYKLQLTKLGLATILSRSFGDLKVRSQEKWDGVWRLVLSDIPNDKKAARDMLRQRLKSFGFCQLQKSVFVIPYPCREEIDFFNAIYNTAPYMRYIETNTLVHDSDLKDYFALS